MTTLSENKFSIDKLPDWVYALLCNNKAYIGRTSVEDPHTVYIELKNLDPDPEFWHNMDPDAGLCYQFLKKKEQIS